MAASRRGIEWLLHHAVVMGTHIPWLIPHPLANICIGRGNLNTHRLVARNKDPA